MTEGRAAAPISVENIHVQFCGVVISQNMVDSSTSTIRTSTLNDAVTERNCGGPTVVASKPSLFQRGEYEAQNRSRYKIRGERRGEKHHRIPVS